MKDEEKTKKQLINELSEIRRRIAELESSASGQKEVEKVFQESERRFRQVAENSGEFIWEVDASGLYTYANPVVEEILGYKPEELIGKKHFYDFFALDVRDELKEAAFDVFANKTAFRNFINTNMHKNGNIVILETSGSPVIDNGHLVGYRGSDKDVTERILAEEKIQRLNKELEQRLLELMEANTELEAFNHSVSHDLQTPLLVIGGYTRRFLKAYGHRLDANGIEMINAIQMSAEKMERLIKDLLLFSRSGRQEIQPAMLDMKSLLSTVLDELKTLSEGRTIKFDIKALPPAYGDMASLKQVLINLLSNAIKFTRSKEIAVIEIGCEITTNENIYYVKDNGIGFYPQYANKLFSPFHRLHGTKEFEGTGVGLSIVQRIINRHGGRVWAEGTVNEGAIFYFSLPRKEAPQMEIRRNVTKHA